MKQFYYIVIFCFGTVIASGQDIHFSQYYSAPLTVNPAQTGLFDGNYRLGLNYRNQWASVTVPYQTLSAFADFNVRKQPYNRGYLGFGLLIIRDQAGDGELSDTKIYGSFAYHLLLNKTRTMQLSFGLQAGEVQETVDFSKLYFDDQWNDIAFDQGIPSGENYNTSTIHYFDVDAGAIYSFSLPDVWSFYAGAGLYNLIEPRVSFYDNENTLGIRPVLQGGFYHKHWQKLYYLFQRNYHAAKKCQRNIVGRYGRLFNHPTGKGRPAVLFRRLYAHRRCSHYCRRL